MDTRVSRYLSPLPDNISDSIKIEYFGIVQEPQIAIQIASCKIDPDTLKSFDDIIKEK